MRYFITPNYCVPLNAKAASSSVVRRIIAAHYPEMEERLKRAHYPPGLNADSVQLHGFVPDTDKPDRPVAMLVREPIDRFLSGVAYLRMDLDEAIRSLRDGVTAKASRGGKHFRDIVVQRNVHFIKQSRLPYGETHLFRFPEHISQMAALLGIGPLPKINITPAPKPPVSQSQRDAILDYYADDVALYNSITQPNTVIVAPTPEVESPEMGWRRKRLWEVTPDDAD